MAYDQNCKFRREYFVQCGVELHLGSESEHEQMNNFHECSGSHSLLAGKGKRADKELTLGDPCPRSRPGHYLRLYSCGLFPAQGLEDLE